MHKMAVNASSLCTKQQRHGGMVLVCVEQVFVGVVFGDALIGVCLMGLSQFINEMVVAMVTTVLVVVALSEEMIGEDAIDMKKEQGRIQPIE